ncbi:MAG: hypothetical protein H0V37_10960 [Chloroflexia bacterium]|nr:hypothetical protein [Chloroflexia bacterium]
MDTEAPIGTGAAWPANHRAALIVIIHVDASNLDAAEGTAQPGLDYAATGLQRLLRLLADLDLSSTTAWSASALASYPQLARIAQDGGHELAVSQAAGGAVGQHEALLSRISDIPPVGVIKALPLASLSPGESSTGGVGQLSSISWIVTGAGGDVPVLMAEDGQQTAIIPVSPYWIDTSWLTPDRPLPPSSLLEAWSLSLAAVRSEGGLMVVVLHPHISGRPGFSSQIERFLDEAIESGDVWIANAAQVAEWWRRREIPNR